MRLRVRDPRVLVVVSAALLGAAVAFPLGVIASHQFSDVPSSSTYHADIDAIRDAGITTGCAVGLYCPKDFVTREQMAAFLNRLGALQAGKTPVVNATKLDGLNSTQFARSDVARTGHVQCHGFAFEAEQQAFEYAMLGNGALILTGSTTAGIFQCPVHLPDGAIVTAFRAGFFDSTDAGSATCSLRRWLPRSRTDTDEVLAGEVATGLEESGQEFDRVDSTIAFATVDNENYAYTVRCSMSATSGSVAILGTTVEYSVAGLPVE